MPTQSPWNHSSQRSQQIISLRGQNAGLGTGKGAGWSLPNVPGGQIAFDVMDEMEIGARVESTGLEIPRHSSLHFIHIRPDLRHHFFSAVSCASAHNSNNSIIPPKAQRGALAHPAPRPGRAGAGTARVCTSGASGPTAPSPVFTLLHGSPGCVWLLQRGQRALPAAGCRTQNCAQEARLGQPWRGWRRAATCTRLFFLSSDPHPPRQLGIG